MSPEGSRSVEMDTVRFVSKKPFQSRGAYGFLSSAIMVVVVRGFEEIEGACWGVGKAKNVKKEENERAVGWGYKINVA